MKALTLAACAAVLSLSTWAVAGETPSPAGAKVAFGNLKDGDMVKSPVTIQFMIEGMDVAPAGTEKPNSGHHHLLLDRAPLGKGSDGAAELDAAILMDENNMHYGKGQTEAKLDLKPGKHTLQMVLGDLNHVPHNPPVASDVITITVE
jgi:Domain of unknown function (DUF4399)